MFRLKGKVGWVPKLRTIYTHVPFIRSPTLLTSRRHTLISQHTASFTLEIAFAETTVDKELLGSGEQSLFRRYVFPQRHQPRGDIEQNFQCSNYSDVKKIWVLNFRFLYGIQNIFNVEFFPIYGISNSVKSTGFIELAGGCYVIHRWRICIINDVTITKSFNCILYMYVHWDT